ncbi:unnamed protein product, partial [Amoebophrya sp. A120]
VVKAAQAGFFEEESEDELSSTPVPTESEKVEKSSSSLSSRAGGFTTSIERSSTNAVASVGNKGLPGFRSSFGRTTQTGAPGAGQETQGDGGEPPPPTNEELAELKKHEAIKQQKKRRKQKEKWEKFYNYYIETGTDYLTNEEYYCCEESTIEEICQVMFLQIQFLASKRQEYKGFKAAAVQDRADDEQAAKLQLRDHAEVLDGVDVHSSLNTSRSVSSSSTTPKGPFQELLDAAG